MPPHLLITLLSLHMLLQLLTSTYMQHMPAVPDLHSPLSLTHCTLWFILSLHISYLPHMTTNMGIASQCASKFCGLLGHTAHRHTHCTLSYLQIWATPCLLMPTLLPTCLLSACSKTTSSCTHYMCSLCCLCAVCTSMACLQPSSHAIFAPPCAYLPTSTWAPSAACTTTSFPGGIPTLAV